jgi:imidazoleglycerol-phosphate dehydratase
MDRKSQISRVTKETDITLKLNLDGSGKSKVGIKYHFWKHMIELFAFFSGFDVDIKAKGDDEHHLVEDIGICIGQGIKKALGEKRGIRRFGNILMPMDETLVQIAIDISGRPYLAFNAPLIKNRKDYPLIENTKEFLRGFSNHSGITVHIQLQSGENMHHIVESVFKGLGVALKDAVRYSGKNITSTKGRID